MTLSDIEIKSIRTIIRTVSKYCVRLGEDAMPDDLDKKTFSELEKRKWFNSLNVNKMQAIKDLVVFQSYKNHFPSINLCDLFLLNEADVLHLKKSYDNNK